ncbi:hypothetical protein PV327_011228 [Microctonus hyperodae]|uniref:Uncharacterized protein n=1 Tax=Microctonus hyperodae TaxID=165561 RepID=A0AA39FLG7_MICHY|nr:hypothetical protein PV327_011228 [Microctonus hyperodae]
MILTCSQGSLSRALGLRPRSEKASPSSSSDTGSLISCQYMSSIRSNSPPAPQLPPRPNSNNANERPQASGPHRSLSERGYSSSYSSSQQSFYSGYSNVLTSDHASQSSTDNDYYHFHGAYYSPQNSGPRFPIVQRYGSLAEETWSASTKDEATKTFCERF